MVIPSARSPPIVPESELSSASDNPDFERLSEREFNRDTTAESNGRTENFTD